LQQILPGHFSGDSTTWGGTISNSTQSFQGKGFHYFGEHLKGVHKLANFKQQLLMFHSIESFKIATNNIAKHFLGSLQKR